MKVLSVDLENCFGIGKLKHEFDFNSSNSYLIYAPNGTMKTSFARTLGLIAKNDKKNQPKDQVHHKKSKFEILSDGGVINHDAILVVNAEDNSFDATHKITSFIASKELKEQYDVIYTELNTAKTELIKKLKSISQSSDCEGEYVGAFRKDENSNFFEILSNHAHELQDDATKISFKYNSVFDSKGTVKNFLTKNEELLDSYISSYNEILSNSKLFKLTNSNNFGTYQANEILKSIEDNSYFEAGHKFVLEDGTEINDSAELKKLFEEEVEKILADEKLKASFEKVDKAIGANVDLRAFKKVIEKDNSLLVNLKDYNGFKQKVWKSFLSEIKSEAEALTELYEKQKKNLESIINEANKELSLWGDIIEKFNTRFYVPFEIKIGNHHDVILKQETANLEFIYKDKGEEPSKQSKENLLKILSKGEQRAYFILQFLFEIESRRVSDEITLLIFDDVADSFDYKNKYAIIEYIRDLHFSKKFKSLILTHNFDFYRTLASRLALYKHTYMATRDNDRCIHLQEGLYMNDLFKEYLKNHKEPKVFISLIAFVRNLIEYTDSSKTEDCLKLTSCLHQKEDSEAINLNEVFAIFKNRIKKLEDNEIAFNGDDKILDFIFSTADSIENEDDINEILLENKITLAVACRLKTEQYLIKSLPKSDIAKIKVNQTRELSTLYKLEFPNSKNLGIIDKVNLMTPENIHINAFMYEPLIDMSVFHLIDLYKNIKKLN
jgi:ABC-type cobalamin/Fe3+-siderophores transport system ATPase subunit